MATYTVNSGGGGDYTTIQSAINAASLGDTINVTAGQTFTENVVLPYKSSGTGYITIQSSALASLPAAGNRVSPSDAANMPKIQPTSNTNVTVQAPSGTNPSQFYKLIGLEIARYSGSGQQYTLLKIGDDGEEGQTSLTKVPHDLIIDRCYIHGDPAGVAGTKDTRRGVELQGKDVQILNSYISDIYENGADSQAIACWNGPGGYVIANNYLMAGGENVLFGGSDPNITNLVPTDILIEHNYFYKPLSWQGASPNHQVKNLLELKNAREVIVRNNILENNWAEAQNGAALLLTVRNQGGSCTWCDVSDVLYEYNIIKNVANAIVAQITDNEQSSQDMHDITLRNNLFFVNGSARGDAGFGASISYGTGSPTGTNWTFDHNTFIHDTGGNRFIAFNDSGDFLSNFQWTNNIHALIGGGGNYADIVSNSSSGTGAFDASAGSGDWAFSKNVLQRSGSGYPNSSMYVSNVNAFGFVSLSNGNFALTSSSPYHNAGTDGKDIGVNWSELMTRTQYVEAGTNYSESEGGGEELTETLSGRIPSGVRLTGARFN